jgi:NAD-dependent dihydropyrimidine dehydrogenase PreA subunit
MPYAVKILLKEIFIPILYAKRKTVMYDVKVDDEKCVGCGECVEVCPVDVYAIQNEKSVPLYAEECLGCESCVEVCEEEAITVTEI